MKFLRSIFGETDESGQPAATVDPGPDPVMAALAELEVKRLREALAAASPAPAPEPEPEPVADMPVARPSRVIKQKAPLPEGISAPARSIWDIEEEGPQPSSVAALAEGEATPRRPTRTKTRVLGFEAQPSAVVPLFEGIEGSPVAAVTPAAGKGYVMFPAGWLVVKEGPGKGASFALTQGVSQIGRGTDQTVALDFGDMAISRQNHAAIAYDATSHEFHVGHGGKSNLVRLNGRPLLATEAARDGDEIQIGETTLVLKVLCTADFNWSTFAAEEGDGHDMAIA